MGRRSKFTPATVRAITEAISIGATYDIAAERAGIHRNTLYDWIRQGNAAGRGKMYDFVQALKQAESRSAIAALATINTEIKKGNLKAAFFLLERRHNYKREYIHHRANDLRAEEKPAQELTLEETLKSQAADLRKAISSAANAESWQAYANLQRQLLSVLSHMKAIDAEKSRIDQMETMDQDQIMDEITGAILALPPLARQRIVEDLQGLGNSNIISLKK